MFTYTWCCLACNYDCIFLLHTFACVCVKTEKRSQKAKETKGKKMWPPTRYSYTDRPFILLFAQHCEKAPLTNGHSDLKKDSDKDEEDDGSQEEATLEKTEGVQVAKNSESGTTGVLADAEDNEDSDVRKSMKGWGGTGFQHPLNLLPNVDWLGKCFHCSRNYFQKSKVC